LYSWKLTLVILASVPILILTAGFTTRKLEEAVETQKQSLTQASKYAFNSISAVDTIKSYNAQDHEVGQFHTAIKSAAKAYLVQANAIALQMGFMRFMTVMMCVQGFWYGRTLVEQGLGAGSVLTCFYSVLMAVQSVESMIPMWMFLSKGMSAGETLKHIQRQMENGREITKMQGCLKPASGAGDIEVHNVGSYDNV
jgi:ATP-binding cassette subfamily B (MDR/TAP) protein 1